MPTVSSLAVTPVKGLALLQPAAVELTQQGVLENRRFYLAGEDGRLVAGLHHGPLCRVRARYDRRREELALELPGGVVVEGSALARGEEVTTDFWGRAVRGRVVDGPFAAALSRYVGKPVRLVRTESPGEACDVHPVTLLSEASVEELRRQARLEGPLDGRRFRMLVHLDGCEPHEEDRWQGRLLRLGEALVRVGGPVPRCATTTRDPSTGLRDFDTLRTIKAYRGLREGKHIDFGMYGTVERPGRVRVGDPAVLVEGP